MSTENSVFKFQNKRTYKGRVVSQGMTERNGVIRLAAGVEIEGQLVDGFNAASSVLPLAKPIVVEVSMRFDPARPDTMGYSIEHLEKLGFFDDDITKLNPNHPQHWSLKGKQVFVVCKDKIQGDNEATYFNFVFPQPKDPDESVAVEDVSRSESAAEFRRLMLDRRRPSMQRPPAAGDEERTPFDGPAEAEPPPELPKARARKGGKIPF